MRYTNKKTKMVMYIKDWSTLMKYITLDKTSKKALYLQIKDSIALAIKSGELVDHDRLPTESEVCEIFGISDIVVKNAYKGLVNEGLVHRVQGSGTYVSTRKIYTFPLKNFDRLDPQAAYGFPNKEKIMVLFDYKRSDESISDTLKLSDDQYYFMVKYVVLIDNAQVLVQTLYLPELYFPSLTIDKVRYSTLMDIMLTMYHHEIKHVKNGFSPINLSASEALLLNTHKHNAAHRVRSTVFNTKDHIIAYMETLFLGQFTQFEVTML